MDTDTKQYSSDDYKVLIDKVTDGTATEEERQVVVELFAKGITDIEAILKEDNNN